MTISFPAPCKRGMRSCGTCSFVDSSSTQREQQDTQRHDASLNQQNYKKGGGVGKITRHRLRRLLSFQGLVVASLFPPQFPINATGGRRNFCAIPPFKVKKALQCCAPSVLPPNQCRNMGFLLDSSTISAEIPRTCQHAWRYSSSSC